MIRWLSKLFGQDKVIKYSLGDLVRTYGGWHTVTGLLLYKNGYSLLVSNTVCYNVPISTMSVKGVKHVEKTSLSYDVNHLKRIVGKKLIIHDDLFKLSLSAKVTKIKLTNNGSPVMYSGGLLIASRTSELIMAGEYTVL